MLTMTRLNFKGVKTMTTAKLEMALRRRGLSLNTVVYKDVRPGFLPSATFLGFYNGRELWLGFRSNVIYRV